MESLKIRLDKRSRFYVLFALLLLLVFIRYVAQIAFPQVIFLAVIAVIAFLGDRDEIIAMCMCCIPLYTSLQDIFALGICVIIYAVRFGRDIRINFSVIIIVLLLIWELLHCFVTNFSIAQFFALTVPFALCIVLMSTHTQERDYSFISRTLAGCTLYMCVVVLSKYIVAANYNFALAFEKMSRLQGTIDDAVVEGATFNPNTLGFFCILASVGLLQLLVAGSGTRRDLVVSVLLLVCGTLTMSLTYFFCLSVMMLLLLIAKKGSVGQKIKLFLAVVVAVLLIAIVLSMVFPASFDYLSRRVQAEDITSGRAELFRNYWKHSFSSIQYMLFGIGLQDFSYRVIQIYGQVPHNGFQEVMVAWGIPGLGMFVLFLIILIRRARIEFPGQRFINYIPLILILTKVQAGQMITSSYTMIMFSFAYLSLCYDFGKIRMQNDLKFEGKLQGGMRIEQKE